MAAPFGNIAQPFDDGGNLDFCVGASRCQYGRRLNLISFCAHFVSNLLGALTKEIRQSALAVAKFFYGDVHAVEHGNP